MSMREGIHEGMFLYNFDRVHTTNRIINFSFIIVHVPPLLCFYCVATHVMSIIVFNTYSFQ